MSDLLGPILATIAVVGIPLISWFSRRATHEGRLLLRVERLGAAYALMPDSAERAEFEQHLRQVVGSLNQWLDADNRARRQLRVALSAIVYVLGVSAVVVLVSFIGSGDSAVGFWLGVAGGALVAVINFGISLLVDRWATRKAASKEQSERDAEASARLEALRLGKQPGGESASRG
jgi:hypothetical protein